MRNALYHHVDIATGAGGPVLPGDLTVPHNARGVVIFAHGIGSGRDNPHNHLVAETLREVRLATLLVDLLDEHEARDRHDAFDEEMIATRLMHAANWIGRRPSTSSLALGYFGASTGAGAVLIAAARQPGRVAAIVSRGGRTDMASSWLPRVQTPTLLIVGELDDNVLNYNRHAYEQIQAEKSLIVVPGATHLFEEPGALAEAADHARRWFLRHLVPRSTSSILRGARFLPTAPSGACYFQEP